MRTLDDMRTLDELGRAKRAARKAAVARIQSAIAATKAIVATGKCPTCGRPIKRNSSLTGWYQCAQFGAEGFRADSSQPACNWQGFTE